MHMGHAKSPKRGTGGNWWGFYPLLTDSNTIQNGRIPKLFLALSSFSYFQLPFRPSSDLFIRLCDVIAILIVAKTVNLTVVLECLFDLTQLPNRTITKTWWFLIQYTFKASDLFYFVLQCGFRLPSTCVLVIAITFFFFFCSLNLHVYYDLPFSSLTVSVKSRVFNVKLINWTSLSCMLLAFVF